MKDLKIKKLKPMFTTVLTTLNVYEEDLVVDGIVKFPKGSLRLYQTVLGVGSSVSGVKEGDVVLLNYFNYALPMYKEGSVKNNVTEMEQHIEFKIPKLLIDDKLVGKFTDRDIEGVVEEYEEVETEKAKEALL